MESILMALGAILPLDKLAIISIVIRHSMIVVDFEDPKQEDFPDHSYVRYFVTCYLQSRRAIECDTTPVTDAEIDRLHAQVNVFHLVNCPNANRVPIALR